MPAINLDISFWDISPVRVTQVVWLPFLFIPLSAVSYVGVPPNRTNEASAMINLMRNLGGSVGVSFTNTMLEQRFQFHHKRLAEHITAYNGYAWNTPLLPGAGGDHELSRYLLDAGPACQTKYSPTTMSLQ